MTSQIEQQITTIEHFPISYKVKLTRQINFVS